MTTNTVTIRYAPYIESRHDDFLYTIYNERERIKLLSPYADSEVVDIDNSFFGIGYVISDFASLYDMYGKFLAGLDIEVLYDISFEKLLNCNAVNSGIVNELELIDDKFVIGKIKNYLLHMRGINAVVSSSFIIGKSNLESEKIREIEKISIDYRINSLSDLQVKIIKSLDWNRKIITSYANSLKDYYVLKMYSNESNTHDKSRDNLWPFEVFDFETSAIGALVRAASFQKITNNRERSNLSKALTIASATATGASMGGQFGGGYGALGGAVIGFTIGITQILVE